MPLYRIFRMKENHRQQFRWAPHTSGVTLLKPKEFEASGEVEANSVYDAWEMLRTSDHPLQVGDLLEIPEQDLRIYKYVGFEEAKWVLPEPKPLEQSLSGSADTSQQNETVLISGN